MLNWQDVLILGDSFAHHRDLPTDWPCKLTNLLTAQTNGQNKIPRGIGYKGGSWWFTRRELLKELDISIPKILVICHTNRYRLPNENNFGLGPNPNKIAVPIDKKHLFNDKIVTAAKMYYENLFYKDFFDYATDAWYKELDHLIATKGIETTVHIRCFDNEDYIFTNGITVTNSFSQIALPGLLRNHFNDEMNEKIAVNLYQLIVNSPKNLVTGLNFLD